MFDLNPLNKPDAEWQLWLLAVVAGFIGFMIGYLTRRNQAVRLETELQTLEVEVDECLSQKIPVQEFPSRTAFFSDPTPNRPVPEPTPAPVVMEPEPALVPSANVDDLKIVEGIGPKIEELLNQDGILTFEHLAAASPERLRQVLDRAGPRFQMHDPTSWPQQARLALDGQWDELKQLQLILTAGKA